MGACGGACAPDRPSGGARAATGEKGSDEVSDVSTMEIMEIMRHLPHRYPFLLVDRVLSVEPGKSIVAIKNVTMNEPFFQGHFPARPVMPGVLIIEAMAQAAGILSYKTLGVTPGSNSLIYFAGIDRARFKKPVGPGDQL